MFIPPFWTTDPFGFRFMPDIGWIVKAPATTIGIGFAELFFELPPRASSLYLGGDLLGPDIRINDDMPTKTMRPISELLIEHLVIPG